MQFWELLVIAVGLSMDAFAVSICKGLSVSRLRARDAATAGLWFGGFQALMPAIGYFLGMRFEALITNVDHWIAFVLLALIGGNMLRESFDQQDEPMDAAFSPAAMLPLAVATSIDALAVGITFALLKVNIVQAVVLVGITTFVFGAGGVAIGSLFGARWKSWAERVGGVVLIAIGVRILLEHLAILP